MDSACYLVKWRLDSCTSISLLLKSLSSFRIAACRGQTRRNIWEKLQRLSTHTAASKPWLYLLLECFMHHLRLSWGHEWFCWILFSHHKSPQFPPLETSKSMNNNIQSVAGLLGLSACVFRLQWSGDSRDSHKWKHTEKKRWNTIFSFDQYRFIFRASSCMVVDVLLNGAIGHRPRGLKCQRSPHPDLTWPSPTKCHSN